MKSLQTLEQIPGTSNIRKTADGRISVFDALKASGAVNPRDAWKRLGQQYPESVVRCDTVKLVRKDGKLNGQPTPVTDAAGWRAILTVLPGIIGNRYRAAANEFITQALKGDVELADSILARQDDPAKLEWVAKRTKARAGAKRIGAALQSAGCSEKVFSRVHDGNNVAITGLTAREIQLERGGKTTRDLMSTNELTYLDVLQVSEVHLIETRELKGDGAVLAAQQEVIADFRPLMDKYLGPRTYPNGGLLAVSV